MKICTGDMFSILDKTDVFVVTTNSTLKKDRTLVMGRGAALQLKKTIPDIDKLFGQKITSREYNIIFVDYFGIGTFYNCIFGALQTKFHFKDPSNIQLINRSVQALTTVATKQNHLRFDVNCPGIGYGKLSFSEIFPIIQQLPNNVNIWVSSDPRR
jgi:hypothetical protein